MHATVVCQCDASCATGAQDFQAYMRQNRFNTDPFSDGSAANALAARYDLITKTPPYENIRSCGAWIASVPYSLGTRTDL